MYYVDGVQRRLYDNHGLRKSKARRLHGVLITRAKLLPSAERVTSRTMIHTRMRTENQQFPGPAVRTIPLSSARKSQVSVIMHSERALISLLLLFPRRLKKSATGHFPTRSFLKVLLLKTVLPR